MVWYVIMKEVEADEDIQKKGIVAVTYQVGQIGQDKRLKAFMKKIDLIVGSLPYRVAAFHFCYDRPTLRPVMFIAQQVFGRSTRLRFRAHFGTSPLANQDFMWMRFDRMKR